MGSRLFEQPETYGVTTLLSKRFAKYVAFLTIVAGACFAQTAPYHLAHTFEVGGDGGWDYITYDSATNSVFVAHGTEVAVIDTVTGKKRGSVPANGAHGVAIIPDRSLGFSANGRSDTVTVFDSKTLQTKREIKVGDKPDALLYDPHTRKIVVVDRSDLNVIDPDSLEVVATVVIPGELEAATTDATHLYVNVADKGEIAFVNSKAWTLERRVSIPGCEDPSGITIDENSRNLFSACSNSKMVAVNTTSGKIIASLATGRGTDGAVFDPELGYAIFPNGADATMTVMKARKYGTYETVAQVPTQRGARTIAIDTKAHRIFLPTAELGPPAEGQKRPTIKPNTFKILEFEAGQS